MKSKESNSNINMEGTSRYLLPVGGGGKGRNLGAIKLFSRGNGGGGIKILQSLRRAGIAVA